MPKIAKVLTHADPQVTLTANTPNVLSTIITAEVPRGLGWVIPGAFPMVMKLRKADGTDIHPESRIYVGIWVPSEPDRIWPVGHRILYYPWAELSFDRQFDADYRDSIMFNLGVDILPLTESERLIIQIVSPDVVDPAKTVFYIPYWERTATEILDELAYRAGAILV